MLEVNKPKLLDRVRATARMRHLSLRTEDAYVARIRQFILFHQKRHPAEMGADEIAAYLTHLAVNDHVAASTQNVALCALLFLYRDVLQVELPQIQNVHRAQQKTKLPVVFSRAEVKQILAQLRGVDDLMARLLYGAGLRVMECARLRVKDIDFSRGQLTVREAKGEHQRVTMLPQSLHAPLREHLLSVRVQHNDDLRRGGGEVYAICSGAKISGGESRMGVAIRFPCGASVG